MRQKDKNWIAGLKNPSSQLKPNTPVYVSKKAAKKILKNANNQKKVKKDC